MGENDSRHTLELTPETCGAGAKHKKQTESEVSHKCQT